MPPGCFGNGKEDKTGESLASGVTILLLKSSEVSTKTTRTRFLDGVKMQDKAEKRELGENQKKTLFKVRKNMYSE